MFDFEAWSLQMIVESQFIILPFSHILGFWNCSGAVSHISQWIGLRENLQETMFFTIKYRVFL
jgi:hypothetical protein